MRSIFGVTQEQLEQYLVGNGENKAKAAIILKAIYAGERLCELPFSMPLIERLCKDFSEERLTVLEKLEDDFACKLLFRLSDGNTVETVVMKHDYGNGVCVSTQVGCNMSCAFCESGRLKKVRSLEVHEIVLQALQTKEVLGETISHVVLMGIGEPFDNFENSMAFVDLLNSPYAFNIGARHITVSTCGIVPGIEKLAQLPFRCCLAISLHAPDNELRSRIMPVNNAYGLERLIPAVRSYSEVTGKKVTFEYIMLKEINDTPECAEKLSALLAGIRCYINLIPYNETENSTLRASDNETVMRFYDILRKHGMWVTVRRRFGDKIKAACGQLRADYGKGVTDGNKNI